jgi:hypothetical protein
VDVPEGLAAQVLATNGKAKIRKQPLSVVKA